MRWLHHAVACDLGTSLKSTAASTPGQARFEMYVYRVFTAANVCGKRGGRVSEDRMSEDGLTDVRAYARVNEVSGTYP